MPIELVETDTSLVVAGAWNTAILNPQWVLRNGLGREDGEQVHILIPAGFNAPYEPPRFRLPEFTYTVRPEALVITPPATNAASIEIVEAAVASMLQQLRHTPISGLGHNFTFVDNDPPEGSLIEFSNSIETLSEGALTDWAVGSIGIHSSFTRADGRSVANISRTFDGGAVTVKFNFHYPISSTEQAIVILRGDENQSRMNANLETATQVMADLNGGDQ